MCCSLEKGIQIIRGNYESTYDTNEFSASYDLMFKVPIYYWENSNIRAD